MNSAFDRGHWAALLCALATTLAASTAIAAPKKEQSAASPGAEESEQDRDAARALALEALELMDAKRWQEALEKLERAYALFRAPTVAVLSARALENTGQLLEARDRYREAAAMPTDADSPKPFKNAVREAKREEQRLSKELPKLVVEVSTSGKEEVIVAVDGQPFDAAKLGTPTEMNPGEHTVSARAGKRNISQKVTLARGETSQVALALLTEQEAPPPSAPAKPREPESRGSSLAWVSLGVGALGLGTGIAAGVVMLDAKSKLDENCTASCPASQKSNLNKFRDARNLSFVGYGVGIVGLGLGVALLIEGSGASSSPVVAIDESGAQLGYWGRF